MTHQLTNAEVENKVAFLVQLNALLTQVNAVVNNNALGSAQKLKLSDLRAATEAWLKDVGSFGSPRPSITSTVTASGVSPAASVSAAGIPFPAAESTIASAPPAAGDRSAKDTAASTDVMPAAGGSVRGGSSSFTADITSAHEVTAGRNLADLLGYLRFLFDAELPERVRLQAFGKSLVRLLMVRCCSTVMASLQHVVHQSYTASAMVSDGARSTSPSPIASPTDPQEEQEQESGKSPLPSTLPATPEIYVELAREITVATKALLGCVQLVTGNAVPTDPSSARFPMQLCVDVIKQTRRALVYFQARMEKEELHLLRNHTLATQTEAAAETVLEDVDAAQETLQQESTSHLERHVRARVTAMEAVWGPSLLHSIRHIGDVINPAIHFLVSVASVRAEGATPALMELKRDAAHDLFAHCGTASSSSGGSVSATARTSVVQLGTAAEGNLPKPASNSELPSFATVLTAANVASPMSVCSLSSPASRIAAAVVLWELGSSYVADYLAGVAECAGDSGEGQLLATRLLADMLHDVAANDLALLRCILRRRRWSRPLYKGVLNCVVSIQPGVLAAGLDALGLLTTTCPSELGQEVGYLHCNVVLRLLESGNTPHYVKRTIVLHYLTTLMGSASAIIVLDNAATAAVPLLLHLYQLYDLNVHAHQLNFVQQLTSVFSRIVRAAPKEAFMQDALVQEQLRLQQEATSEASANPSINGNNNGGGASTPSAHRLGAAASASASPDAAEASTPAASASVSMAGASISPASLSLPAMALHGLVRIVELLTTQAPPEDKTGHDVLAELPVLVSRELKLKEQQQVDLFNASPKKAMYRLFNVTAEENAVPEAYSDFAAQWDHTRIPPIALPETVKKVEDAVDFLTHISSLDHEAVAEFLTTSAVFPLHVATAYLRRLPLAGRSVLEAISELLMRVQLPKEGQRIERLLEFFSAAYFDANSGPGIDTDVFPFKNDTAVFIVVVATVMLNTNIHNPSAGMRLDLKSFRGQLRRCNADESFADAFVDEIFYSISTRPLESVKTVTFDVNAAGESASRGAFDVFFVSQEEKRQLAFGVERQRMVSETRQLLQLHTIEDPPAACDAAMGCAIAKDLFLSTWSSVCAVFGPAMYEGTSAPKNVLLQCVRGLQSLLCTAAAFDLETECTVTLLTLLRMADSTPVGPQCRRAVLAVAATSYAIHLPVRCWVAVFQLMLEVRLSSSASSIGPRLVEDVFNRMEGLTRLSMEAEAERATAGDGVKERAEGGEEEVIMDKATVAVHRMLEGIMTTTSGYAAGDATSLAAALMLLRRSLEYGCILHGRRTADVVYYVNIRDFTTRVVPTYVELIQKHRLSDDALQVLFDCLVELLCTMWVSYSTKRVSIITASAADMAHIRNKNAAATSTTVTLDTAPPDLVRCFRALRTMYESTLAAPSDGSATLLQMHVLQAVKEVMARTVHAVELSSGAQHLSLCTMVVAWQQVLFPLAMALCDRHTSSTEAGSLALLVLRKVVALGGGTGGTPTDHLPPPVRGALLSILAQLAYMGGMCGDVDGAQVCVALLSSICTTTLSMAAGISSQPAWSVCSPASPLMPASESEKESFVRYLASRDPRIRQMVASIEEGPGFVVQRSLARLGLLLRCEREQTRTEVVHQLGTLSLQMRPAQVQTLAEDLAEVVLEGAIGHAAHHHKTAITHPSLVPFLFFQMPVPPSMRRCSRSAFRATLPAALSFLASELLSGLTGQDLATTAETVMQRCLMPILLSPNSPYQSRFAAARALSQCITVCMPQDKSSLRPSLARCVLRCVSLALIAVRVPLRGVLPPAAAYVGRRWVERPSSLSQEGAKALAAYESATAEVQRCIETADPQWIVRGPAVAPRIAAESLADGDASGEVARRSGASNDLVSSGNSGGSLLSDEQLIEYVNLVAQILSGLPRELPGLVSCVAKAEASDGVEKVKNAEGPCWALPESSGMVLLQLALQSAGILFGTLWRINHPLELEQYVQQAADSHRRDGGLGSRNGGLLPHSAVRSVLQCYMELALLVEAYSAAELLAVSTDLIEGIRQVQSVAQPNSAPSSQSAPPPSATANASLAVEAALLQRLSPQEQQHVRTCNSGMYQQLSAVLGYLVKALTEQSPASAAILPTSQQQQKSLVTNVAADPQFFRALVSLLTPTAGPLILTVRDYFAWYIADPYRVAPTAIMETAPSAQPAVEEAVSEEESKSSSSDTDVSALENKKPTQSPTCMSGAPLADGVHSESGEDTESLL